MRKILTRTGIVLLFVFTHLHSLAQPAKRLYIANDDHTDFMWSLDSAQYVSAFVQMLDAWMDINDATAAANPGQPNFHSKWNCDGSYWISFFEKVRGSSDPSFTRLINQIKDGKITVPYSPLVSTYGGQPVEAVLRGMYYAGQLERRFNLDLSMATAMENQTMPLGISSLWKGSGAKYAWHGVCNCDTKMDPNSFGNRQNEMYWFKGKDTNQVLLKWYKMIQPIFGSIRLGGYGEIWEPATSTSVDDLAAKVNTTDYPYNIAAAFGVGHDNPSTLTDGLVNVAMAKSIPGVQDVIVSNEVDFFQEFENTYQPLNQIDTTSKTFGNEWDLNCASIAAISGKVKRAIEKLRGAEAMAAIEINFDINFMAPVLEMRKEAWESIGLFWEHSIGFTNSSNVPPAERIAFQHRLERDISGYADALYNLAKKSLARRITKGESSNTRFFVFNPLGWVRTDYADYRFNNPAPITFKVVEVLSNTEVPYQFIQKNGDSYLRILAENIPSVGYKTFEIVIGTPAVFQPAATNTGNTIENDYFEITYTNQGVLTNIVDKQNGNKQIVTVAAGRYVNDMGSGAANNGDVPEVEVGPVFLTVTTKSFDAPNHTTKITVYKNIPRIDIDNSITDNFADSIRTWSYSFTNTPTTEIWHEETGAVIKAKLTTNGGDYSNANARYDWSSLNHFASVNETANGYGVTVSNNDCYFMKIGNSTVTALDETSSQLNILAGGRIGGLGYESQGGDAEFNQRFSITTHAAYSAPAEMKKALEHQNGLVTDTVTSLVNFLLPEQFSFVSANDPGTLIWCVKPAEEETTGGIITRAWNLANTGAAPTLTYGLQFNNAYRTTHVETNADTFIVAPNSTTLQLPLGHNEMKTIRVMTFIISLPANQFTFTGHRDFSSTKNLLKWSADDERSTRWYTLERSTDGNNFFPVQTIAKNNGSYIYYDDKINTAENYYYRIKMINANGRHEYSHTVFIRADADARNLLVYPNPATDIINTSLILRKQQRCNVAVVNAAGAIVKTTAPPLFERGYNTYTLSVKELPAGPYNIVITTGDKKYVQPFIKK
jgi:alpha-mannosidase